MGQTALLYEMEGGFIRPKETKSSGEVSQDQSSDLGFETIPASSIPETSSDIKEKDMFKFFKRGNGGNDGDGGGTVKGFFDGLGFLPRLLIGLFVSLCFILLTQGLNLWNVEKQIEMTKKANEAEVAPVSSNKSSSPVAKSALPVPTFSCETVEKVEAGFANSKPLFFDGNSQPVHVGSGCVLVNFSGAISKLTGKGYRLSVIDPKIPGNFFNCGDIHGSNDSIENCLSFINDYFIGSDIRVAVSNNGHVNFN